MNLGEPAGKESGRPGAEDAANRAFVEKLKFKEVEEVSNEVMKKLYADAGGASGAEGGMPGMPGGMPDMSGMGGMPDMSGMGGMPDMSQFADMMKQQGAKEETTSSKATVEEVD